VIESQEATAMIGTIGSARQSLRTCIRRFLQDKSGATAIEYAMIASGIAVAIASTVMSLGSTVKGLFTSVSTAMK
jgi:pilus assembly protein Flp/PilA